MVEILFGLIGWIIPLVAMGRSAKLKQQNPSYFSCFIAMTVLCSMTMCGFAIWMALRYQAKLLAREDFSAMQDILPTTIGTALFLLISTVVLNLFFIYFTHKRNISS